MNTRQTWWLAGMAIALFLFIVFVEQPRVARQDETPSTLLMPGLQRDQVTAIEISEADQPPIALRKSGSFWEMEAPLRYPAQAAAAERWLQILERASWIVQLGEEEIAAQGTSLEEFGLNPPQTVVTVRQGSSTFEVRFGSRLAVGGQFYVQIGGEPGVMITDTLLEDALPRSAMAWRDTALMSFSSIAVSNRIDFNRIEIRPSTNGFTLQPDPANGRWRIVRPISARGDSTKIGLFLQAILPRWRVEEFVTDDPTTNLDAFGLRPPEQELAIGRGTNDLLVVQFGRSPTNRPDLVYARQLLHTNIVLTARTNLDLLRRPYSFWRDGLLLTLDTNRIQEIAGQSGGSNFTYRVRQMTNGNWRIIEPEPLPVDPELVAEFLRHMNSIQITAFEKDVVTDFSAYGLADPLRQFTFLTATNGVFTNLNPIVSFGTNAAGQSFARRSDETAVYAIAPAHLDSLPLAYWQWRDRSIWSFQTNEVQRVRITEDGRSREVLRTADGKWALAPGSTGALNLSFDEAVFRIGQLGADRWTGRGSQPALRQWFGFSTNSHQLTFEVLRGGVMQTNTVEFGGVNQAGRPFAACRLEDGELWYFEFPMDLYWQYVKQNFSLQSGPQ